MQKRQVLSILLLVGAGMFVGGCVVAAVGAGAAGTVAFIRGDLEAAEAKKLDVVYDATLKALEELELPVSQKSKDKMSALIVAHDARSKKIKIKLHATTEETTKISIRVGWFGSESKSRMIYEEIQKNLQ